MAVFRTQLYSQSLMQEIAVTVTLPLPTISDWEWGRKKAEENTKFQVLWLLHSGAGDETKILRSSRIEEYAKKYQLAVVMPPCANSCGCDLPGMGNYHQFLAKELPLLCQSIYPLSPKREDNFIGGISIGGYAAMNLALRNPDQYAAAFSISGALSLEELLKIDHVSSFTSRMVKAIYGEHREYYDAHQHDLKVIAQDLIHSGKIMPKLFAACGTKDVYYQCSKVVVDAFRDLSVPMNYFEDEGAHDWDTWDRYLIQALDWIRL